MTPKLYPEYSKMLSTPAPPADGPRKNVIESLQKQIDFHVGESYRLRYVRNLHAPVSRLHAELLAMAFLHAVDSGLRDDDTRFATGTFVFLRVCRHWNETALSSPRLWGWWVPGAVKAWPLFHSRSKDGPLFLKWEPQLLPTSAQDILMDPAIPSRICRLDISGTSEELMQFFGAFNSSPSSNVSSIRLKVPSYDEDEPKEHLARFLSSSFPKLSQLHFENFLHISSSPIFTTSGLTSLKLSLSHAGKQPFTLSQFSQILQQHPNLQELDLGNVIPPPGPSGAPSVPLILPRLVNLRLEGGGAAVLRLIGLIDMSSPLHNVAICLIRTHNATILRLVGAMNEIIVPYYECQGMDHPRKVNHLTISYDSRGFCLVFNFRSHSTPRSNLRFLFDWTSDTQRDIAVKEALPLFPLDDVREFAVEGSVINKGEYRGLFQRMKNISHLRLDELDIRPVLDVFSEDKYDEEQILPKLESLTLSHLETVVDNRRRLLNFLKKRRDHNVGLQKLAIRSCETYEAGYKLELRELVKRVKWDNVKVLNPGYWGVDEPDTEELEDYFDDYERESHHELHS